jgi:YtoQ family protein
MDAGQDRKEAGDSSEPCTGQCDRDGQPENDGREQRARHPRARPGKPSPVLEERVRERDGEGDRGDRYRCELQGRGAERQGSVDAAHPLIIGLRRLASSVGSDVMAAPEAERVWNVYLAGEIHSDWRERIHSGAEVAALPVIFTSPVTDHPASDDCGVAILGSEDDKFWHDHKGAGVNALRTQTLLRDADIVVVRFGEQYKQWNAAFDAGQAAALDTPLITLHPPEHDHALKEVDRAALAVAREPEQVVAILRYVINGEL